MEDIKKSVESVPAVTSETFEGGKTSSYFQEKYKQKVKETVEAPGEHEFVMDLRQSFDDKLIGQQAAKETLSQAIVDSVLRLGEEKGPLGVYFFHGPTGVGKTEIVKALSETLFGRPGGMIKINCENFSESHSGSNLFGSPKGYIGSDKLTPFNNKNVTLAFDMAKQDKKLHPMIQDMPWVNIVLFDEIEKAHPIVIQQLLGMLDEGKVTLSSGEVVNFQNSFIIFTSNLAQVDLRELSHKKEMGFVTSSKKIDQVHIFQKTLYEKFSPEFIGRIHSFIEFNALTKEDGKKILELELEKLNNYLLSYYSEAHIQVELSPDLLNMMLEKGFSQEKGARELVRTFHLLLKRPLSRFMHSKDFVGYFDYKDTIIIGVDTSATDTIQFYVILEATGFEKSSIAQELESDDQVRKINLDTLLELNRIIANFSGLHHLSIEEKIDVKEEIYSYVNQLRDAGFSQRDIARIKSVSLTEILKEFNFINDFECIGYGEYDEQEIFAPYTSREISKIMERKIAYIYANTETTRQFLSLCRFEILQTMCRLYRTDDLTPAQYDGVSFFLSKIFYEKYGIIADIE